MKTCLLHLEEVRLLSARGLAVVWWHCLCEHSGVGCQTLAEQAQLVTVYWKALLQCLFDSDPAVRETAWLCLNNISQQIKVSERNVQGKGTYAWYFLLYRINILQCVCAVNFTVIVQMTSHSGNIV